MFCRFREQKTLCSIPHASGNYVVFWPQVMPLSSTYLFWLAVLSDHRDRKINLQICCQEKIFVRIWYYSWWIYSQTSRRYSSPKNSHGLYKLPHLFQKIYRIFLKESSGYLWLELIICNYRIPLSEAFFFLPSLLLEKHVYVADYLKLSLTLILCIELHRLMSCHILVCFLMM